MPGMRYQPQGLARVSGNWVASGMVFSVQAGTGLRDLARGLPMLGRGANQALRALPGGLAFDCRGVATAGYVNVAGEAAQLAGDQSVIFDLVIAGAPSGSVPAIGGIWRSTIQNDAFLIIERSSADAIQVVFRIGGVGSSRVFNPGISAMYGQRLTVAVSIARGMGRSVWLRIASEGRVLFDQEASYTAAGSSDVTPTGTEYISVGSEQIENVTRNPNCMIYSQHHLARVVSAEEVASLSRMPWQVYQAIEDEIDSPTAVERRIAIQAAALGLASGQVGMRALRRLRAAPAGLAVTAGQVALRAARRMRVQQATAAMLAGPVRLLVSRRFGVQPAALAVAGQGVTLSAGRRLQVASASLVLAGGQVGMQYNPSMKPGEYTLPVSAAAMTMGGGIVGMRVTRRLPVEPAVIVIKGQQVSFLLGGRAGAIDASKVPPSRTVRFAGGKRVAIFSGGVRVATFNGGKRTVRF